MAGIVEFLGWFGAVTVLAGYLLFSTGRIPNGPVYQLFNLIGGLAVAINVAAHHAVPSTIVNGIWALVAIVVLVKMARARKRGAAPTEPYVLHAEPPATTAVLPVIGPALRDHEPDATTPRHPAPGLQADADPTPAPTPLVPITGSIPVITAALAIGLLKQVQEQHQSEDRDASTRAGA